MHRRTGFLGSSERQGEIVPLVGPHPEDEYSSACEWYRRQGWRREPLAFDEPTEPAFEAALRERLDAETALVYADWLARHGHPRAPLIVVQHARRARPAAEAAAEATTDELAAEEARLFEHHADVLLGTLGAHLYEVQLDAYGLELTWEHGFITAARVNRDGLGDAEPVVDMLLHHRSARLLRELVIGCHQGGDQDNRKMAEVLLYASPTPAPPLRKLHLADFDDSQYDGIDISRCPLGDLSGLGEIYPLLEDVVLKGRGDVELGGLALTRARRFALRTSTLTRRTLGAILRAPWPELVELELWFGDTAWHYGAECTLDDALPLLGADGFPKLRALRIMNAPFIDELCPRLLTSSRVRALEVLDLSLGSLGDAGADILVGGRDALAHLRALKITESCLRPAARARLLASGLPVDESPVSPARTPARSKAGRYTSVNE
ncbi:MAG TPA: TIGR02996 domain-containing protein [Kofleriaceae bacterium]|nr:TIGR02996 domain-containing protein [Kofleriaceae bacterium]